MNWESGYSSSYFMAIIDPRTWKDIDRMEITGGSVSRALTGLRHSADVDCVNYPQKEELWVRIYLDAHQGSDGARVPLFTGLAAAPDRNVKGSWYENAVQCYSVLKPADDVYLTRGWYAPVELSVASIIEQLLEPSPAPIVVDTDEQKTLNQAIIAESGETNLTMVEKILLSVGWNLRLDGDGTIHIGPFPDKPAVTLDPMTYDVIETELQVTEDWYSCPNCFMAVNNDMTGIAKDEREDSRFSIQNRSREIWFYESGCSLEKNETIAGYAMRRLKEEQRYAINVSYDRRFIPDVMPGDVIKMHYPHQGVDGDFIVNSQTIELSHGAKTSENIIGSSE